MGGLCGKFFSGCRIVKIALFDSYHHKFDCSVECMVYRVFLTMKIPNVSLGFSVVFVGGITLLIKLNGAAITKLRYV